MRERGYLENIDNILTFDAIYKNRNYRKLLHSQKKSTVRQIAHDAIDRNVVENIQSSSEQQNDNKRGDKSSKEKSSQFSLNEMKSPKKKNLIVEEQKEESISQYPERIDFNEDDEEPISLVINSQRAKNLLSMKNSECIDIDNINRINPDNVFVPISKEKPEHIKFTSNVKIALNKCFVCVHIPVTLEGRNILRKIYEEEIPIKIPLDQQTYSQIRLHVGIKDPNDKRSLNQNELEYALLSVPLPEFKTEDKYILHEHFKQSLQQELNDDFYRFIDNGSKMCCRFRGRKYLHAADVIFFCNMIKNSNTFNPNVFIANRCCGVSNNREEYCFSNENASITEIEICRNKIKMKYRSIIHQYLQMYLSNKFELQSLFVFENRCNFLDELEETKTGVQVCHNVCNFQYKVGAKNRALRTEFMKLIVYCKINSASQFNSNMKMQTTMFTENLIRSQLLNFYPTHQETIDLITNNFPLILPHDDFIKYENITFSCTLQKAFTYVKQL